MEAKNVTATALPRELDELPWLNVGKSREIILGLVLAANVRDDKVDAERFHVDPAGLDAVGRMGGHGYARTLDYIDLPTLSVEVVAAVGRIGLRDRAWIAGRGVDARRQLRSVLKRRP